MPLRRNTRFGKWCVLFSGASQWIQCSVLILTKDDTPGMLEKGPRFKIAWMLLG